MRIECVSLQAQKLGSFDGVTWVEGSKDPAFLDDHEVEAEVMAMGLSFNDVACAMEIVPEFLKVHTDLVMNVQASYAGLVTVGGAATIPVVYTTAVYSLINIANLQRGQSVPIHSAAGGLDQACIQIAQHVGAEIYITVGSNEKDHICSRCGLLSDHVFSSTNPQFADQIRKQTGRRGADLIINIIIKDLLNTS
ncbi:hypothetical protein BDV23DRAFT_186283 [Aspergillus alliaceus]|uniref:Enoyl reductase (ER) domain-containing protein n=1 Tax=Petromyces alliaceus TaxID=209559 RepID=A0A5N7C164_PETAA|nr:hypothetical protein BDV23DRAFT_186283 [Aspergillus alliaceus]